MDTLERRLITIVTASPAHLSILGEVAACGLPDCWVAAGFVRDLVWDHLHGRTPELPRNDIDVIWFDAARPDSAQDKALEAQLSAIRPDVRWSVDNQARMHLRNDDPPYASAVDAMRHWPETATAVAVQLAAGGQLRVAAPHGLADLFAIIARPTPGFMTGARHAVHLQRVKDKGWRDRWPLLRIAGDQGEGSAPVN
ncbi:nucleotidyltransferase family protein (plasmid) [Tistrella mobilis]|uniref:nucleotidyltransferase family protein n=1 Tax=Tistrella mobilis TaxID=171437 RepID=UPI003558AC09